MLNSIMESVNSMTRKFKITGLDNGYPIQPYYVDTDSRGDISHHLNVMGDSVRYYEEIK